jgi:hypothetical protein
MANSDAASHAQLFRYIANPTKVSHVPRQLADTSEAAPIDVFAQSAQAAAQPPPPPPAEAVVPASVPEPAAAPAPQPSVFEQAVQTKRKETDYRSAPPPPAPAPAPAPRPSVMPEVVEDVDDELEKQACLLELQRLQTQGVALSKSFSMQDSLPSMQFELRRKLMEIQETRTVGMLRDGMTLMFSGIEVANSKWGPILDLQGWSAEISKDTARFEQPLTRMYRKYYRRSQMSAEAELLFAVVASAVMFHVGKRLTRPQQFPSAAAPAGAGGFNPMQFASMFTSMAGGGPAAAAPPPSAGNEGPPPTGF